MTITTVFFLWLVSTILFTLFLGMSVKFIYDLANELTEIKTVAYDRHHEYKSMWSSLKSRIDNWEEIQEGLETSIDERSAELGRKIEKSKQEIISMMDQALLTQRQDFDASLTQRTNTMVAYADKHAVTVTKLMQSTQQRFKALEDAVEKLKITKPDYAKIVREEASRVMTKVNAEDVLKAFQRFLK